MPCHPRRNRFAHLGGAGRAAPIWHARAAFDHFFDVPLQRRSAHRRTPRTSSGCRRAVGEGCLPAGQWPSQSTPASFFYQSAPDASFLRRAVGGVTMGIRFSSLFDQSLISRRKSFVAKAETTRNGMNKINGGQGDSSSSKLLMKLTVSTPFL